MRQIHPINSIMLVMTTTQHQRKGTEEELSSRHPTRELTWQQVVRHVLLLLLVVVGTLEHEFAFFGTGLHAPGASSSLNQTAHHSRYTAQHRTTLHNTAQHCRSCSNMYNITTKQASPRPPPPAGSRAPCGSRAAGPAGRRRGAGPDPVGTCSLRDPPPPLQPRRAVQCAASQ